MRSYGLMLLAVVVAFEAGRAITDLKFDAVARDFKYVCGHYRDGCLSLTTGDDFLKFQPGTESIFKKLYLIEDSIAVIQSDQEGGLEVIPVDMDVINMLIGFPPNSFDFAALLAIVPELSFTTTSTNDGEQEDMVLRLLAKFSQLLPPRFSNLPNSKKGSHRRVGVSPSPLLAGVSPSPLPAGVSPSQLPAGVSPSPLPAGVSPSPLPAGVSTSPLPAGVSPSPLPAGVSPSPFPGGSQLPTATPKAEIYDSMEENSTQFDMSDDSEQLPLERSYTHGQLQENQEKDSEVPLQIKLKDHRWRGIEWEYTKNCLPMCRKLGQYFPHLTDCNAFYHCDHSGPALKRCGPGTAFDPYLLVCNYVGVALNRYCSMHDQCSE